MKFDEEKIYGEGDASAPDNNVNMEEGKPKNKDQVDGVADKALEDVILNENLNNIASTA